MEDILNKLLESDLLSEETRGELTEAWKKAVEAKKAELREEAIMEVRAELAEQWVEERDALINKIDAFVSDYVAKEVTELKEDIERFRDLEVEYAARLVEEKKKLAEEVAVEIDSLVDKIDNFLEVRIVEEIEELKEDLEVVKQNDFGRRIFEAFSTEYNKSFADDSSIQAKLAVTESKLVDAQKRLAEVEGQRTKMVREAKMEEVLRPLTGGKREQMQFILQSVETEKLEEAYKHFVGRILKETVTPAPATDTLTEDKKQTTTVVTGDPAASTLITEGEKAKADNLAALKRYAGLK